MLKAGRSTLCALRQFGSCVSEVKRPRPAGPEASALRPPPTFLSKLRFVAERVDEFEARNDDARAETGNFEPVDGAVFAREFREPFHRMGGVNVEEVADQQVPGRARNWLKMRRVFHGVSPPIAFQPRQSAAGALSVQAETGTEISCGRKPKDRPHPASAGGNSCLRARKRISMPGRKRRSIFRRRA